MNSLFVSLNKAIDDKNFIMSADDVNELARRYPYFSTPAMLYLAAQRRLGKEIDKSLLHSVAILSPDRDLLVRQVGDFNEKFQDFYSSDIVSTADTDTTIDSFLNKYGNSSQREISAIEMAIFNPQPEYATVLEKEIGNIDTQPTESQSDDDRRLAAFISAQNRDEEQSINASLNTIEQQDTITQPTETGSLVASGSFTQSLASSYIKQHKYEQALDILQKLAANEPDTNSLIFDRIRYIKKLIALQKYKK